MYVYDEVEEAAHNTKLYIHTLGNVRFRMLGRSSGRATVKKHTGNPSESLAEMLA